MTTEQKNFWERKAQRLEEFAKTCKFSDTKEAALRIAEGIRKELKEAKPLNQAVF